MQLKKKLANKWTNSLTNSNLLNFVWKLARLNLIWAGFLILNFSLKFKNSRPFYLNKRNVLNFHKNFVWV